MVTWTKSELAASDKTRDPYELWFRPDDAASAAKDGIFRTNTWYPILCKIQFAGTAETEELQDALLATVYDLTEDFSDLDDAEQSLLRLVISTTHDAHYAVHTLLLSEFASTELVAFAQLGTSRQDIETLFRRQFAKQGLAVFDGVQIDITAAGVTSASVDIGAGRAGGDSKNAIDYLRSNVGRDTPKGNTGAPVIGVVIDHAIGFANRVFRTHNDDQIHTRFHGIWLQDGSVNGSSNVGSLISADTIDRHLDALKSGRYSSEEELYSAMQVVDTQSDIRGANGILRRASHGTAVAHVAFGADPDDARDVMGNVGLLGIQLPFESVARTNGYLHDLYVKSALNWVWFTGLVMASQNGGNVPRFFLNHSFGTYAGRPDGHDPISADFDRRIELGEIEVITAAAGNSFQSATHARVSQADLDRQKRVTIGLSVPPDNKTPSFVRIWADPSDAQPEAFPIDLTFEFGDGTVVSLAEGEQAFQPGFVYHALHNDQEIARLYCQRSVGAPGLHKKAPEKLSLTLAIGQTADEQGHPTHIADGRWQLHVQAGQGPLDQPVGFWVERGESPDGFPQIGRQARFVHPNYERFDALGHLVETDRMDCPIKRGGTLSAAAASSKTVVVGSYRASDDAVSDFSSASSYLMPRRTGGGSVLPLQPRYAAVSEDSPARPNILVSGSMSGSVVPVRGTSFAAPHAMRQIILDVLDRPVLDVVNTLAVKASKTGPSAPANAKYRLGRGRLTPVFSYTERRYTKQA